MMTLKLTKNQIGFYETISTLNNNIYCDIVFYPKLEFGQLNYESYIKLTNTNNSKSIQIPLNYNHNHTSCNTWRETHREVFYDLFKSDTINIKKILSRFYIEYEIHLNNGKIYSDVLHTNISHWGDLRFGTGEIGIFVEIIESIFQKHPNNFGISNSKLYRMIMSKLIGWDSYTTKNMRISRFIFSNFYLYCKKFLKRGGTIVL